MYQSKYYSTTFNLCACRVRMTELNTLVTCSRHTAWWRNKTWLTDIWSLYIRQSTWKVHRIMSWSRTLTRNLKNFRAETCILKTMWEKMQALYFVKGGIHRTLKIGLKCYDSHKALQLSLTIRAGKAWESSFMSFFFSFFLCVCMCMWGGGSLSGCFPQRKHRLCTVRKKKCPLLFWHQGSRAAAWDDFVLSVAFRQKQEPGHKRLSGWWILLGTTAPGIIPSLISLLHLLRKHANIRHRSKTQLTSWSREHWIAVFQ